MGLNTVFLAMNDFNSEYRLNPNLYINILERGYPNLNSDNRGLKAIACLHCSKEAFFRVGDNSMNSLEVLRRGKTKDGRNTVTLLLD